MHHNYLVEGLMFAMKQSPILCLLSLQYLDQYAFRWILHVHHFLSVHDRRHCALGHHHGRRALLRFHGTRFHVRYGSGYRECVNHLKKQYC